MIFEMADDFDGFTRSAACRKKRIQEVVVLARSVITGREGRRIRRSVRIAEGRGDTVYE